MAAMLTTLAAGPVLAATCDVEIESNDAMQFNVKNIDVPKACKKLDRKSVV